MTPKEHVKYQREMAKQLKKAIPLRDTQMRLVGQVSSNGACFGITAMRDPLALMPLWNERKHDGLPYRTHLQAVATLRGLRVVHRLRHSVAPSESKGT